MATTILNITPERFSASIGKLDSEKKYIFKTYSSETFVFPYGSSIDITSRGLVYNMNGIKLVTGTNGTFVANFIKMIS